MEIKIDDQQIANALNDFCESAMYTDLVSDNVGGWKVNPESKLDFMQRKIVENINNFIGEKVSMTLNNKAIEAALATVVKPLIKADIKTSAIAVAANEKLLIP